MLDPMTHDERLSDSAGQDGSGLLMDEHGLAFAYAPHPLAELFPMIGGTEFASLVEDVRANGVRRPIVMFEGKVLDGRNRYMAAREVGCGYPVVEFTGADPVAYVVSENLHRRHLSDTQRQMIGAKIAKLPKGVNQHSGASANGRTLPTAAEAAAMLNTTVRGIERARSVVDHGAPALVAAVDAGEVSVSAAAEVAKLPEAEQVEIVAQGAQAVRDTAKAARQKPAATVEPEGPAEPVDPERRKLAKLTTDALIDEVLGLRADLADEKAKTAALQIERDDFKAKWKEATTADMGKALGNAQRRADTAVGRMKEHQAEAARLGFRLKKALARVEELEGTPIDMGAG